MFTRCEAGQAMRVWRMAWSGAWALAAVAFVLPAAAETTYNHYFGNTHSHTVYSDGDGTPADHFRIAKGAGH